MVRPIGPAWNEMDSSWPGRWGPTHEWSPSFRFCMTVADSMTDMIPIMVPGRQIMRNRSGRFLGIWQMPSLRSWLKHATVIHTAEKRTIRPSQRVGMPTDWTSRGLEFSPKHGFSIRRQPSEWSLRRIIHLWKALSRVRWKITSRTELQKRTRCQGASGAAGIRIGSCVRLSTIDA